MDGPLHLVDDLALPLHPLVLGWGRLWRVGFPTQCGQLAVSHDAVRLLAR